MSSSGVFLGVAQNLRAYAGFSLCCNKQGGLEKRQPDTPMRYQSAHINPGFLLVPVGTDMWHRTEKLRAESGGGPLFL